MLAWHLGGGVVCEDHRTVVRLHWSCVRKGGSVGVEEILTSLSASGAELRFYIIGGGGREESSVSLPRRTDVLNAGGGIMERILSCIGIVASPFHAPR